MRLFPEAILRVLRKLDTRDLYETLNGIPRRRTKHFGYKLNIVQSSIADELKRLWGECIKKLSLKLPLLVMDEAHHLKNSQTRLASLFKTPDSEKDADEISKGPLSNAFERMLFLTATPFQLGHYELCSVLDRFRAVSWRSANSPSCGLARFNQDMSDLREKLDAAQVSAVRLDKSWGKLVPEDISCQGEGFQDIEKWWEMALISDELSPNAINVIRQFKRTNERMRVAETALNPWVIRHMRPKQLEESGLPRRKRFEGKAIIDDNPESNSAGINVEGDSLLPFLLAARATACSPESRPVFAEGLASCYEAFLYTRNKHKAASGRLSTDSVTDTDDDAFNGIEPDRIGTWYLDQLLVSIPREDQEASMTHPKIKATIDRAMTLWLSGEKVLIFCHFIATGKVLRQHISYSIRTAIIEKGSMMLGCKRNEVMDRLDTIGDRFHKEGSILRKACDNEIGKILKAYPALKPYGPNLIDVVRRYLRTPSFLIRYFPLGSKLGEEAVPIALSQRDGSGISLKDQIVYFFSFLMKWCGEKDRETYIESLDRIQTGSIRGKDITTSFSEDEIQGEIKELLLPNVRLVNGATLKDSRQRLMLSFNTPFYPEILVASKVMAEGVDLHLNCRHIIHHDLCWNPSTLEQRTGRIDRIGGKVERCNNPIHVYLPYISETQDEKMYRVVIDRERWFKVVMGEKFDMDALSTDKLSERLPLPVKAAETLSFNLSVV